MTRTRALRTVLITSRESRKGTRVLPALVTPGEDKPRATRFSLVYPNRLVLDAPSGRFTCVSLPLPTPAPIPRRIQSP